MIDSAGWFDFAERVPAHPSKIKGSRNPAIAFIAHSAEGYENYLRNNPPTTKGWGWHLSNLKDGTLLQHMPINAACWSSGHDTPNFNFVAMETEGVAGEPMTAAQLDTCVRVIRELSAARGWVPSRDEPRTLHEHCEWSQTACPSGRYLWPTILERLQPPKAEEDAMQRWQGLANPDYFKDMVIDGLKIQDVWARSDFGLPVHAKSIELVVYLKEGGLDILDGDTGKKAGFCVAGVSHYRVIMDPTEKGLIGLKGYGAVLDKIECVGFYQ